MQVVRHVLPILLFCSGCAGSEYIAELTGIFWRAAVDLPTLSRKEAINAVSLFAELKRRNVIRVIVAYLAGAWLLIQVADTVFPAYGFPDSALAILITVLVIGLVPATVLSWVFEWTPEGLRRDADVAAGKSIAPQIGKRLDRVIMVVLALGVGFFAFDKFVLDPARDAALEEAAEERGRTDAFVQSYGDKSIAVLPFADLSPDGDQGFLSDGVAEEILNLLAQVRELRVISRSSAFRYRGDVHIPTVAEDLDVSYVLEGSVRKSGDRMRVTAQLIDARADAHVWSENFDRSMGDIFAIQDDIARRIVDELKIKLTGSAPHSERTNPVTYQLYLQAKQLIYVEQVSWGLAEELLQQALERDPRYLPAVNLMVAATFNVTGDFEEARYTFDDGIARMRGYVDRVLAIDPGNSAALAHRSWMAFWYRNDLETAAEYLSRALKNDPANEWALYVAMVTSRLFGRNEDAIVFARAQLQRDPLCSGCLYNWMKAAMNLGRYDEALAASERRMRVAEGGWVSRGDIYLLKGDAKKALECYENQAEDRAGFLRSQALAFHEMGDFDARDRAIEALSRIENDYAYYAMAEVQAWIGNMDSAFEWLGRYLDPDQPNYIQVFSGVLTNPFLRNLHEEPRWRELREDADMTEERLAKIRFEMP
jgi:adenylate cyclase